MPKIPLKNESYDQISRWAQTVVQLALENTEVYKLGVEFARSVNPMEVFQYVTQSYTSSVIASKQAGEDFYTFPVLDFLCVALCRVPPKDLRQIMRLVNEYYNGVEVRFEGLTQDKMALVEYDGRYLCVDPLELFPILDTVEDEFPPAEK